MKKDASLPHELFPSFANRATRKQTSFLSAFAVVAFSAATACARPAPAAVTPTPAAAAPAPRDCGQESRLARNIMLARQTGTPLDEAMRHTYGDALIRDLVVAAYSEPHYQTPEHQTRAAGDFADAAMLACLKP